MAVTMRIFSIRAVCCEEIVIFCRKELRTRQKISFKLLKEEWMTKESVVWAGNKLFKKIVRAK